MANETTLEKVNPKPSAAFGSRSGCFCDREYADHEVRWPPLSAKAKHPQLVRVQPWASYPFLEHGTWNMDGRSRG